MFSKIKRRLLNQKKIRNYLQYAIGEIILIVIGILIAVSINNWNERRHQKNIKNGIFSVIVTDVKSDTAEAKQIINFYKKREATFLRVASDSLSNKEVRNCNYCPSLITTRRLFRLNKRGFQQLREYKDFSVSNQDSLIFNIINFYSQTDGIIETFRDDITRDVNNNIKNWRNEYPWFVDIVINRKLNDKASSYFGKSQEYKNKVAHHYVLIYRNYVPALKTFLNRAENILSQLQRRLDDNYEP